MSDNNLDPRRRAELFGKFPAMSNLRPMDPVASTQVRAVERAEAIIRHVWPDAAQTRAATFDPALCPPMVKRADEAADEYRTALAAEVLTFDTADTDYSPDEAAEHGVVRVWEVDTWSVRIVRDRWRDERTRGRRLKPVEFFGGELAHSRIADHSRIPGGPCTVHIAGACGGPTRLLPCDRGTLILLFRCCRECESLAGRMADNAHRSHVIEARADLPPGAQVT